MSQKTALLVIAPKDFRDEELLIPRATLMAMGIKTTLASTKLGQATGMLGATVTIEKVFNDVKDELFDAIVIVGGMGSPEFLWEDPTLQQLIKTHQEKNRLLSAICLSGAVLANAGALNDKKATVWPSDAAKAIYDKHNVNYIEQPVVIDGNCITANGPEAALEFANAILNALELAPMA